MIYKAFVDLRVGTADEREKQLAAETLAKGTRLEVGDAESGKSFELDQDLYLVSLAEGGAAAEAGAALGMRLIGFGEELVQRNVKWARLRTFAGTKPFPHVFTFSDSNPEGGKAALAAHAERLAAAEAEKAEKAAAAAKIKEETEAALTVLTADTDDEQPAKEREAIERLGAAATLGASEHIVGWLCARMGEGQTPPVQLKCLSLLAALGSGGSTAMKGVLLQQAKPVVTAAQEFSCEPHEKLGDKPQTLVREQAAATLAALRTPEPAKKGIVPVSTPGARKAKKQTAAEAALIAGLKLEVTEETLADSGFVVDETLFVVDVAAGGLAAELGVKPGMSLIGFGEHHADTHAKIADSYLKWTTLKRLAAATPFPHL